MKIILTGANGFIGSKLLDNLDKDIKVYAIIKDSNEKIDHIIKYPNVSIVYCELEKINDLKNIISDRDIDACIHLAWAGSFGDLRADYNMQLNNSKYSLDLVNVLSEMNVKRFVCAGTLAEKDVLNYHLDNGSTPNAVSIYGIAKLNTHLMTKALCNKLGIEHMWCYLSNTYGVGNSTNNFVNMASRKMLHGQRASFTSGEQYYDFVYVDDTVKAIIAVMKNGKNNSAYYLGSGNPRKLKEFITIIRDTINPNIELYLGEVPFNGKSLSIENYDSSDLINDTGFIPSIKFEDGITKTIEWLKKEEQ